MDKVIIVGTYEFIGFQLCLTLLEQGIEVIGIHLDPISEDPFLEEKRLDIGRNSNFTEKDETYLVSLEAFSKPVVLFIDYYSYYFKREENKLSSVMTGGLLQKYPFQIVLTLPIQLYHKKLPLELSFQRSDKENTPTIFYLPTVYGPWQPMNYTFQQVLNNPNGPIVVEDREWTEDALYIDDVMDVIMKQLDSMENKEYVLKSKIKDHWKKLLSILIEEGSIQLIRHEEKSFSEEVQIFLAGDTDPEDGIEKQKRHLKRLEQNW